MTDTKKSFLVAGWQVEPALNRVTNGEGSQQIEPRTMRLLVYLMDHAGQVASREDIFNAVWPNMIISDESLTRSIADLRKVFGDSAQNAQVIETIRKVGYRFIASIQEVEPAATSIAEPVVDSSPKWIAGLLVVVVCVVGLFVIFNNLSAPFSPITVKQVRPLTSASGLEFYADISHAGDRVAYNTQPPGDYSKRQLVVKSLDGQSSKRIGEYGVRSYPAWSWQDNYLAYEWRSGNRCEIWIYDWKTQKEQSVIKCPVDKIRALVWTPQNDLLINGKNRPQQHWSVWQIALGKHLPLLEEAVVDFRLLPLKAGPLGVKHLKFSHDGSQLVYVKVSAKSELVKELSPVKGRVQWLSWPQMDATANVVLPQGILGLDFTPENLSLLLAVTDKSLDFQLINLDQSGQQQSVYNSEAGVRHISMAATGAVVIERWDSNKDIYSFDISSQSAEKVVDSTRWDFQPSYGGLTTEYAFISTRSGNAAVWLKRQGSEAFRISQPDSANTQVKLSPDNRYAVFVSETPEGSELVLADLAANSFRTLTRLSAKVMIPSWSQDGKSLLFSRQVGGLWQIFQQSIDSDQPRQLTQNGGYSGQLNKDYLYFVKYRQNELWQLDLTNGKEKPIEVFDIDSPYGWQMIGHKVYWLSSFAGQLMLNTFEVQNDALAVHQIPSKILTPGMAELGLSPDGKSALVTSAEGVTADLILIDTY